MRTGNNGFIWIGKLLEPVEGEAAAAAAPDLASLEVRASAPVATAQSFGVSAVCGDNWLPAQSSLSRAGVGWA